MNFKKNVKLASYTTFMIGGPAEYFCIVKNVEELVEALEAAEKLKLPVLVFGGGSNLLVADGGIKGLIIKLDNQQLRLSGNEMTVDAGVPMESVVNAAINNSLKGLEWAGGLPGTFGGAIRGNAGAFGGEMKDLVAEVVALDKNYRLKAFTRKECNFSYRSSIFKEEGYTIISATIALTKGDEKELRAIADSHIAYRNEKHPLEYPSAGSVFKNVPVEKVPAEFLPAFEGKIKKDPFPIVPAAWFIIGAGLTGRQVGKAQISVKHSNYIVNLGNAKAQDVLELIEIVKKEVKAKYGIALEVEIQYVK